MVRDSILLGKQFPSELERERLELASNNNAGLSN